MDSKFVKPVYEYIKPIPNRIKQDENPPNKKYFKPAEVADSEFLYKVAKIYSRVSGMCTLPSEPYVIVSHHTALHRNLSKRFKSYFCALAFCFSCLGCEKT